jgi:hypothetical protein
MLASQHPIFGCTVLRITLVSASFIAHPIMSQGLTRYGTMMASTVSVFS